ncbi:hypothetical protein EIL87_19735 [Saccharopolyspora rhizosphaerae]|uniref:Uncharacterized protein n=1 Tax=Saccharopolyspora rhizosphaerae TaxID=2492662 RepID=A0A426JNG3_9PSEU|nr:hypothetical protein [Saccharopolyspora rhizosphaerae]RRO14537.1 hypothetical protein EIL87_19735 [Saccharopolyspora rhizosphaerae]
MTRVDQPDDGSDFAQIVASCGAYQRAVRDGRPIDGAGALWRIETTTRRLLDQTLLEASESVSLREMTKALGLIDSGPGGPTRTNIAYRINRARKRTEGQEEDGEHSAT